MSDWKSLVQRAKRNDREAFGTLVEQFQAMAVGYAYSILHDYDLAQDAAQEAFLQAYLALKSLQAPEAFPGWLRRIVFSQCTRHLRGRQFRTVPLENAALLTAFEDGPAEAAEREHTRCMVQAAIRSLPEAESATITLFYIGGYSHAEVGQFLDVPVSTVKSRLYSARLRLRERMLKTMEQTLPQLTPDQKFTERVLTGIQKLSWTGHGSCTFAGALSAATAVTGYPLDYQTILGFTGLAFRTRWFTGPAELPWCPSSPVGEFPEEIEAARRASGWRLRDVNPSTEKIAPQVVATIDAGIPALAYDAHLNMSVLCGYEDEGNTVLLQSYSGNDGPIKRPTADLPIIAIFLDKHTGGLSPHDAAVQGITIGVRNFKRRHDPADNEERGYWHGAVALHRWAADIGRFDEWTEEDREKLLFVTWWNFQNFADARMHASAFLRQITPLFHQAARPALEEAVRAYNRETDLIGRSFVHKDAFLGPWSGKSLNDWTPEIRAREQEMLHTACAFEADAIQHLEEALAIEAGGAA